VFCFDAVDPRQRPKVIASVLRRGQRTGAFALMISTDISRRAATDAAAKIRVRA
jgi:hypothetical protein